MYSAIDNPRRWLLTAALEEHAARIPHAAWLDDSSGDSLTFHRAEIHSRRAAGFLERAGVERGERVGVLMLNGCAFATVWLGLARLAAVAVFFNTELRGAFLRHQINDSKISCLVVHAELLAAVAELAAELPHLKTVVAVGADRTPEHPAHWRLIAWPDLDQQPDWEGPGPAAEDIACIMYTSGTSGPSKGVLMPHAHCTLYGIGTIKSLQLTVQDRYYVCLPLYHANALFMQLGATLLVGIPAFVRRRFSATTWLDDIRRQQATVTNNLGALSAFVLSQPPSAHDRDHRLRAMLNAPNLAPHEAQFRERFGVRDVVSGFGMTECNIPVWGRIGEAAPGAAGWVHEEHFTVRVVDPQTDEPLPPGRTGEIVVRPQVPFGFMAGYFNAPEKTVEAWRNLWFHTGDAGVMREDGLLTFVDRIRDCIRRRGENISATEVEEVVSALPGVDEVAAYAVPSDVPGGEDEIVLAVVPKPGVSLNFAEIVHQAASRLPRFARPRFIRIVDALPKTGNGKVRRAVLRDQGVADAHDIAGA